MKVAVIGSGSWGTALALHAARIGHDVWLWSRRRDVAAELDTARVNTAYLPGFPFPPHIRATSDLAEALRGATLVVLVVPSHGTRQVLGDMERLLTGHEILVCASKGIENESLARMSEVVTQVFDGGYDDRYVVLSGPSFAAEVARDRPDGRHPGTPEAQAPGSERRNREKRS